jgi:hypothetical protein
MKILVTKSVDLEDWLRERETIDEVIPFLTRKDFETYDKEGNVIFGNISAPAVSRLRAARYVHIEIKRSPDLVGKTLTRKELEACEPRLVEVEARSKNYL